MRLLLAITDGPGVRNFIYGRFPGALRSAGISTTILSGLPEPALRQVARRQLDGTEILEMPIYRESRASHLFRKSLEVAHMKCFATVAMRVNLVTGRPRGFSSGALGNRAAYLLAGLCSRQAGIRRLAAEHERSVRANPLTERYRARLRDLKPDLLFVTHQRPPQSSPLVAAAKSLGIPTATFIFSWDNLTSKGRIPVSYDHYLVWSDHMRSEALRFYPDLDADNVHVVGTPQFEPYAYDEFGWAEERFNTEVGLRAGPRRICYTCGDNSTAPNDPFYLSLLAEANRAKAFENPVEIVVRPSPAEADTRFDAVRKQYPELKWAPPRWIQARPDHPEPWSQRIPSADDVDLLKSTIQYSDLNVNVASTMTLDFAHCGKPVVNVGFGGSAEAEPLDDSSYYNFDHYRPVVELAAVRVARNARELVSDIKSYLANPDLDSIGRKRLLNMQVHQPLSGTSERLVQTLLAISAAKSSSAPCPA